MAGTELAVGYVSLAASGRNFGRSIIREAQSAGSSAGDAASSRFGSRFVSGMGAIGRRAGIALAAGVGAAGFFGIKTAADFEQTRIAFEGILGDVEQANALLGDLRDFAAKTPFEFTGLADSAKNLLAVGFTADEIIPTMAILGNVAATLGVGEGEIKGVVRALGQMRGKGKASAEELQQISEQIPGFSAIGAIAENMGITTAEAFDLMAKGAIPADDAIEAILAGMEDFPGAAGAMDRQSKTLNGVLSTFKDTVSGIAIDFITPYLPAISSAVSSFGDVLSGFFGGLKTGYTEGADGAEAFGGRVSDVLTTVGNFIRDEVVPRITSLVSDGFQAVKDWWDENGETVKEVAGDVFGSIKGIATDVVNVIKDELIPRFTDFATWMADEGPGLEIAIAGIATAMGVYAANAIAAAIATVIAMGPFILLAVAVGALAWATDRLIDRFDHGLSDAFQHVVDGGVDIFNFFSDVLDLLVRMLAAAESLKQVLPDIPWPGGGGLIPGVDVPLLPWADDGGVWPGPKGVHSLGWVAGGETVLPTHKADLSALVGGSSLFGGDFAPVVVQQPGEDSVSTAMRELNRVLVLMG